MTEHAPLPVAGYTTQSGDKVAAVNVNKQLEELILQRLDWMKENVPGIDPRWLAAGRTQIEKGFMAINRAVFQPQRVQLDEALQGIPHHYGFDTASGG